MRKLVALFFGIIIAACVHKATTPSTNNVPVARPQPAGGDEYGDDGYGDDEYGGEAYGDDGTGDDGGGECGMPNDGGGDDDDDDGDSDGSNIR